jgi:hypothetical protein
VNVGRGAYLGTTHYADANTGHSSSAPFKIPLFWRIANYRLSKLVLIKISELVHFDLVWSFYKVCHVWLRIGARND